MTAPASETPDTATPAPAEGTAEGTTDGTPDGSAVQPGSVARDARRPAGRRNGRSAGNPQQRNGAASPPGPAPTGRPAGGAPSRQHPVLDQLATLYPALFGETPRPLKRGIYEDLLAAHPQALDKDSLKAALALHARSSRYLTVVASGQQRHDLSGQPVEALTPEQVHHALIEVFRRRGARSPVDLRPKLRQRILQAFEASGLSPDAYIQRVQGRDEEVNQLTRDALAEATARAAREDALLRAFEASGKDINEFANMYGLHILDANRSLERARARAVAKG